MKPKKAKPKKKRTEVFTPKKVRISTTTLKKATQKITSGHRFGKKWFPHDK